jgi:hypothetical protein
MNNEIQPDDYLIEITKSGPQFIDPKKSYYLFDKQSKSIPKSPRRDLINCQSSSSNNKSSTNISFQIPSFKLDEDNSDPIKDKIEQKIIDNIKNRDGFESLLQDPDINKFLSK